MGALLVLLVYFVVLLVIFFIAYLTAGCLYGTAVVVRRAYLSIQFSKLGQEEKDGWLDKAANLRLSGRQRASIILSVLFLLSMLFVFVFDSVIPKYQDTGAWGYLYAIANICLALLPPFIIGVQARAVWKRKDAFLEEAGVRGNAGWMRAYYAVLISTWLFAVVWCVVKLPSFFSGLESLLQL